MLSLKEVELSDRQWVEECLRKSDFRGSEYTFTNLFDWASAYTVRIGKLDDFLIIRSGATVWSYLYPAGTGDVTKAVAAMKENAASEGMDLRLYGICPESKEELEAALPGQFEFKPTRDSFEYIYTVEKLSNLAGKKLHGKRNHIKRFMDNNPDWAYERITRENIGEAWAMNVEWCKVNRCYENHSLQREACAVKSAFDHFFELGLVGGMLKSGGRVVAYTMGRPLNSDTFVVHIEKAFSEIQGAYPVINQQFVLNEMQDFTYVNREDDVGDEGLRKAKLSYYPDILLEKYYASEKK